MITINSIDFNETLRYLGNNKVPLNSQIQEMFFDCEKEFLTVIEPRFLYKIITLDSSLLQGQSIKDHLKGCEKAVVMCATIGSQVDRLIRKSQITDMAKAVIFDAMGSVAVEKVCNKAEEIIFNELKGSYLTWRFSPGYGDYPIELQKYFLQILNASAKIGLCTNDSFLLTPTKSVTAIMGISKDPVERKRRGCNSCNLVKTCKFRKAGTRCEF